MLCGISIHDYPKRIRHSAKNFKYDFEEANFISRWTDHLFRIASNRLGIE